MQSQPVEAVRGELGSVFFHMDNVTLERAGGLEARHGEKQTYRQTGRQTARSSIPFQIGTQPKDKILQT